MSINSVVSAVSRAAYLGSSTALEPDHPTRCDKSRTRPAVAQEFEAFVLQSFVETMLPGQPDNVFGKGTAGALWKSMLAEQIAREIARSGGIGIARMVERELAP